MDYRDELENLGLNVTEGIDRVMGDEELYETMLGIFVDTVHENKNLMDEFESDDLEDLIGQVHMMKGMSGNLSIMPLYEGYMEALGLLRNDRPEEAKAVLTKLLPIQEKIIECIEKHRTT